MCIGALTLKNENDVANLLNQEEIYPKKVKLRRTIQKHPILS